MGALVDTADRALEEKADLDRTPLDEKLEQLNDKLSRSEPMRDAYEKIIQKKKDLRKTSESLRAALDGNSVDGLQERVQRERLEAQTRVLRHRLGEIAAELVDRTGGDGRAPCPICEKELEQRELEHAISTMVDTEIEKGGSGLRAAEAQLNTAQQIESAVQELSQEIEALQSDLDLMIAPEDDDELTTAIKEGRVADYIESVTERKASIAAQLNSVQEWLASVKVELQKLRDEAEYQQLQRDLIDLKAVRADMCGVQQRFDQLVKFGESVMDIRDAVGLTLKKVLHKKIPDVARDFTSVFGALTGHPHFDCLAFDEKKLPKLELVVASSSDSSGRWYPTGVLNGQAQGALALVPYFALSRATEAPTEVCLVLLDDPTRAFDREHIQILIEQLAGLGERVQVVVATQETEAFRTLLPKSFKRESYVVVEPKSWSYADGPKLVTEYD